MPQVRVLSSRPIVIRCEVIFMEKYTMESVESILSQNNKAEMLKKYTKAELTEMHIAVCGCSPLSAQSKEGILKGIIRSISSIKRGRLLLDSNKG